MSQESVSVLPKLLTPDEAAIMLCIGKGTLAQWRHHQRYPLRHLKIGRAVRYLESDVRKFIAQAASDARTEGLRQRVNVRIEKRREREGR